MQKGNSKTASQLLALSMFIMLLAFFIILNGMSSFEETKVQPAMESIEAAFGSKTKKEGGVKPSVTPSEQHSVNEGDTVERLQALFRSQIPGVQSTINHREGTMHVTLKWLDFKKALEDSFSDSGFEDQGRSSSDFMPILLSLVRSDQLEIPYHMDIILNITKAPATLQVNEPQTILDYIFEVSSVASLLEEGGLPPKLMTAGLSRGVEDMVDIYFRIYYPYNPFGTDLSSELSVLGKAQTDQKLSRDDDEPIESQEVNYE